jgi:outer membrane protein assembly factor BamB
VWSYHEALGCGEHGNHGSPALIDGKLIFGAKGTLLAFEAASGKPAWRLEIPKDAPGYWEAVGYVTNPFVATRISGTPVLIAIPSRIIRAADGQLISQRKDDQYFRSLQTPVIADGMLYADGEVEGRWKSFQAIQLPAAPEGAPTVAWQLEVKDYRMEASSGFSIASGIVAQGIYFTVDTMGGFTAIDTGAKTVLYKRRLEMYQRADRGNYGFTASLTAAGKNLYAFDDTGCGLVLEAGKAYKEVGRNIIENLVPNWWQDYKQELFYASPVFAGASMYLKGSEYLYCIRAP